MKRMFFVVSALSCSLAHAQSEAALKQAFEGRRVTVKMDMPATKYGVDVLYQAPNPLDFKQYSARIKQYGISLRNGESTMITLIKVKDSLIEFQLGGGGYGTIGDDTSTSVYTGTTSKTRREKDLENDLKYETDPRRRRRMEEEVSELRSERHREDRRLQAEAATASELKRQNVQEKALQAGSRFNLRFPEKFFRDNVPTEDMIYRGLSQYVEFEGREVSQNRIPPPPPQQARSSQLRRGMSESEVRDTLGEPANQRERSEGQLKVRTLTFRGSDSDTEADFLDGVLIRFRINSK